MKKFIITVDTNWCGMTEEYAVEANEDLDLDRVAQELAYENYLSYGCDEYLLELLFPDVEKYTDEMYDEMYDVEGDYYSYEIKEVDESDENEMENYNCLQKV